MQTVFELSSFIQHLAMQVTSVNEAHRLTDVEPALIVYFSSLTRHNISKDALSKVSKTFFKEVKMNYRKLGANFTKIFVNLSNLFSGHESQTVASFWQFMVATTCERVADEHAHFMFTILKDRLFTEIDQL